jgi:hypothetical protein
MSQLEHHRSARLAGQNLSAPGREPGKEDSEAGSAVQWRLRLGWHMLRVQTCENFEVQGSKFVRFKCLTQPKPQNLPF